ncbi:hypothetical protein F5Y11DRAFT_321949 [Daldinia sp. FL1419]|nr:hypothetical protein F5Y11DRAFT_321949 [Daldinia sp. FL1419]
MTKIQAFGGLGPVSSIPFIIIDNSFLSSLSSLRAKCSTADGPIAIWGAVIGYFVYVQWLSPYNLPR